MCSGSIVSIKRSGNRVPPCLMLPGLLNTSTSVCRLFNDVVSSRIECAKSCAHDDQCVLFMYDRSGNCSTYCGIERDLGGSLGTVYIANPGTNIFLFVF